jgi:two-component system chemotaxis sensor kinase CheA
LAGIKKLFPSGGVDSGKSSENPTARSPEPPAEDQAPEKEPLAAPPEPQPESEMAKEHESAFNEELYANFLTETDERLARAQELTLALEDNPDNEEGVNELFRIFHTIKGECGFLKIVNLGELAHSVENIFVLLRDKALHADEGIIDLLLKGVDQAKKILNALRVGNINLSTTGSTSLTLYLESINKISESVRPTLGAMMVKSGKVSDAELRALVTEQKESVFTKKIGELAIEEKIISQKELEETLALQKSIEQKQTPGVKTEKTDPIVKVRSSKVNFLVDMIGELLIAMGQISDSSPAYTQVRKISKTIQYASMQLRTESVKNLFGNAKRIVRDISKTLKKGVILETYGEDLEIDRELIEQLDEPLMHIVRNSMDHGIEPEEERRRKGKSADGKITIGAERRGNHIVISITDDGQGLNRDKILAKALEKGLITIEDAKSMTDAAIFNLIFLQGFSTKEKIDYVSGRGVGMDIVKSAVTKAKGRVELETERDKFTRINLYFPLSTAIIDGMLVKLGPTTYIIPIASVLESIKLKAENVEEIKRGISMVKLRDEVIPLIRLKDTFEIRDIEPGNIGICVESSDKRRFVLAVNEIIAKREVVIKSLGSRFKNLRGITSGTVLAGGQIGLVLDVDQIVELSQDQGKLAPTAQS